MTLIYRPDHPEANENGMVDRSMVDARAKEAAPHVISDTIEGTWHPADGHYYDSKSNFRRVTKSKGMVEVGNEKQVDRRDTSINRRELRQDIHEAIQKVNQGYRPNTEHSTFRGDGWN